MCNLTLPKHRSYFCLFGILGFLAASNYQAYAAVIPTITTNVGMELTPGFVNSVDLIQASQTGITLTSAAYSGFTAVSSSNTASLNNATLGTTGDVSTVAIDNNGVFTAIYTLKTDTPATAYGFDITRVDTYSGWVNNRFNQRYTLSYNTVSNPSFVTVGEFQTALTSGVFSDAKAAKISLADNIGLIAAGVSQIRFEFNVPIAAGSQATAYREIEIFGTASIQPAQPAPEPAALWLLLGLCPLIRKAKSKRLLRSAQNA